MGNSEKSFVETMLKRAADSSKTEASSRNDCDVNEIENITKNIQKRLQERK
ncbi:MAG TPA: hypothetical protein VKE88_04065 [Candidatus Nanoarchaeia archaeon]|nr:hypothetical protein [Candidatus Nanoarchaeia archaeon]